MKNHMTNMGYRSQRRSNDLTSGVPGAEAFQLIHAAPDCGGVENRAWPSRLDSEEIEIVRRLHSIEMMVVKHS